ncbi:MAG: GYD domain-containing protein, partial [Thermoplasmata archaeon]
WTSGRYDGIAISEAADDETASAETLALSLQGDVRTETLRAFGHVGHGADSRQNALARKPSGGPNSSQVKVSGANPNCTEKGTHQMTT